MKNNNVHNALLKLQSENEMRSSSSLNINNLMSKSNNTNCSNDNSTITSSSSVNISNNSRNTTTTSTINSGNSNCNNTQNININVQDMGLFPRYDRNRPLQAYQDLYISQANMYLNALQQQSLGMDIVVKVIIIILWAGLCKYIGIVLNHCVDQEIVISIIEDRAHPKVLRCPCYFQTTDFTHLHQMSGLIEYIRIVYRIRGKDTTLMTLPQYGAPVHISMINYFAKYRDDILQHTFGSKKIIATPTCLEELTVYRLLSFMGTRGGTRG